METQLSTKTRIANIVGLRDFRNAAVWRSCVMEMCLAWVYVCSSITISIGSNYHGFTSALPIIAFSHFIVLSLFFRSGCPPSDAHFNPLVTLGAMFSAKYTPVKTLLYIIFQCTGATFGALCARHIIPKDRVDKYLLGGCTIRTISALQPQGSYSTLKDGVTDSQAFLAEFIFSFVLQFVTFYTAMDDRQFKITTLPFFPFIIAATVAINIYISGGIALGFGGSYMNPARCFGPALAYRGELLGSLWIFLLAPALAALCSAIVYLVIPPDHVEIYREKEDFIHQIKSSPKLRKRTNNNLRVDEENYNNPSPIPRQSSLSMADQ